MKEFLTNAGPVLQSRLEKRKETESTSWLHSWWNDLAYMAYRDPVVIFVSYFYTFRDDKRVPWNQPAYRAASIVTAALEFKKLIVELSSLCSFYYKR